MCVACVYANLVLIWIELIWMKRTDSILFYLNQLAWMETKLTIAKKIYCEIHSENGANNYEQCKYPRSIFGF